MKSRKIEHESKVVCVRGPLSVFSCMAVCVCVCEAPWVYGVGNGVGLPLIGRDGPF